MRCQLDTREQAYYPQLFAQADIEGSGRIKGTQAASFLYTSGIDKQVLKRIWDIADSQAVGSLGPDDFNVALRLVAHSQAGLTVYEELAQQVPRSLPYFSDFPSPPQQPSGNQRGRSPPPGEDRVAPSPRDLRKYGRLFCSLCSGASGSLSGDQGKELFDRSGLSGDQLSQVWQVCNSGGCLGWPQFVAAMHLVRQARAGQPVPSSISEMPPELTQLLGSLEAPEVYASQRSRSPRAHSGASSPFGSFSPSPSASQLGIAEACGSPAFASNAFPKSRGADGMDTGGLGPSSMQGGFEPSVPPSGESNAAWPSEGWQTDKHPSDQQEEGHSKKSGHRKHHRHHKHDDNGHFPSSLEIQPPSSELSIGQTGNGSNHHSQDPHSHSHNHHSHDHHSHHHHSHHHHSHDNHSHGHHSHNHHSHKHRHVPQPPSLDDFSPDGYLNTNQNSPDFGHRRGQKDPTSYPGSSAQPVEHLEALIEADKTITGTLRHDVDALNAELLQLELEFEQEEREAARERAEVERIGLERDHLTQQLEASQRQLGDLKVEHQGLHFESVLLRRDNDHFRKQAAFLQKLFDDGMRDTQTLRESIDYLEQSNHSLLAHTRALEEARREMLEQAKNEKELLHKEQRNALEAKQALEALRSGNNDEITRISDVKPVAETQAPLATDNRAQRFGNISGDTMPWWQTNPQHAFPQREHTGEHCQGVRKPVHPHSREGV